jgi:hypothetical protein
MRCGNGDLTYDGNGHLEHVHYCTQEAVTNRFSKRGKTLPFCQDHASRYDVFTGKLLRRVLATWERLGDEFMTDSGHTRPELRPEHDGQLMIPGIFV